MAYAVIRVRGQPDVNYDIEYTMKLLGINKVNHCAIVPENAVTKGMLQKIKDYTTYTITSNKVKDNMKQLFSSLILWGDKNQIININTIFNQPIFTCRKLRI